MIKSAPARGSKALLRVLAIERFGFENRLAVPRHPIYTDSVYNQDR